MLRAVRLLRFAAWGLSCYQGFSRFGTVSRFTRRLGAELFWVYGDGVLLCWGLSTDLITYYIGVACVCVAQNHGLMGLIHCTRFQCDVSVVLYRGLPVGFPVSSRSGTASFHVSYTVRRPFSTSTSFGFGIWPKKVQINPRSKPGWTSVVFDVTLVHKCVFLCRVSFF